MVAFLVVVFMVYTFSEHVQSVVVMVMAERSGGSDSHGVDGSGQVDSHLACSGR